VFERVVCARRPAVAAALGWLRAQIDAHGAPITARMSGTGACVFADFERAVDAERIAARVPDRWNSFVARGLNRSPLHAMLRMHG
jgi:4-diphosphocytidyl-2-C-methyl-D-erythritol kinase